MNLVEQLIRESLPLPDRRQIWEWAADHVDFGNSTSFRGPFDVENVPWIRGFMRAMHDPHVRRVSFIGPPQESGKTKATEVFLCYRVTNSPANMAFNHTTNENALKWRETRWRQMMTACNALLNRLSDDPNDTKRKRIALSSVRTSTLSPSSQTTSRGVVTLRFSGPNFPSPSKTYANAE